MCQLVEPGDHCHFVLVLLTHLMFSGGREWVHWEQMEQCINVFKVFKLAFLVFDVK